MAAWAGTDGEMVVINLSRLICSAKRPPAMLLEQGVQRLFLLRPHARPQWVLQAAHEPAGLDRQARQAVGQHIQVAAPNHRQQPAELKVTMEEVVFTIRHLVCKFGSIEMLNQ